MKPLVAFVALAFVTAACAVETAALGPPEDRPAPGAFAADATAGPEGQGAAAPAPAGPVPGYGAAEDAAAPHVAEAGPDAGIDPRDAARDAAPDVLQPSTPCDRDGDGRLAPSCGGDDCCDVDARVHRGVTAYFDTPNACGDYDYDCDGYGVHETGTLDCRFLLLEGCAGDGFQSDTFCGATGAYAECAWLGWSCGPTQTQLRRQRCR